MALPLVRSGLAPPAGARHRAVGEIVCDMTNRSGSRQWLHQDERPGVHPDTFGAPPDEVVAAWDGGSVAGGDAEAPDPGR